MITEKIENLVDDISLLREENEELKKKVAELERDAARYRFLKMKSVQELLLMAGQYHKIKTAYEVLTSPWTEWDSKIDAALNQERSDD